MILYRKDKDFYKRVKNKIKGNWFGIFITISIIGFFSTIMTYFSFILKLIPYISNGFILDKQFFEYFLSNNFEMSVINILPTILKEILAVAFYMALLDGIRSGRYHVETVFYNVLKKYNKVIPLGLFMGFIESMIWFLPSQFDLIVLFMFYILKIALLYVGFFVRDYQNNEIIDYYIESGKKTNNHKFQLFKIWFRYYWLMILGLIITIIGVLIVSYGDLHFINYLIYSGFLVVIVGSIFSLVIYLRNGPYYHFANALYYDEQMKQENNY